MSYRATAAVAHALEGDLALEAVSIDGPGPREVLVDVRACGICHTDAKFRQLLPLPAVFGHEGTGIVVDVGEQVRDFAPGDRVVMSYPFCNRCPHCLAGEPYRCDQMPALKFGGRRLDGTRPLSLDGRPLTSAFFQQSSFATRALCLEDALVRVESELADELLAALPCGVQTGAGAVLNSFAMSAGDSLLVIGAGSVGLAAVMAARAVSAGPVICVDPIDARLELALELGASHVLSAGDGDLERAIAAVAPRGLRYALDASATEAGLKLAIRSIGRGGSVGIVSYPAGGDEFPFTTRDLFLKAGSLQGIIQGSSIPRLFIPRLIELHRRGRFPVERLITTYAFADINRALADAERGAVVKPVLLMA